MRKFLLGEDGSTVEYLVRVTIIGLGGASILFAILAALRHQGGTIIDAISTFNF